MIKRIGNFLLAFSYAKRELQAGIKNFYIFIICLALAIGAISGVASFSQSVKDSLYNNGKEILGGDIALRTTYKPATSKQLNFLKEHIGPVTTVIETRTMARKKGINNSSLVELKAVDPFYPLYGKVIISDKNGINLKDGLQDLLLPKPNKKSANKNEWGVVVGKSLLKRLNIKIGDSIMLGSKKFKVRGIISKEPDRVGGKLLDIAPRVMISSYIFSETGLNRFGSQVYYDSKIILPPSRNINILKNTEDRIKNAFPKASWKMRDYLNAAPRVKKIINRMIVFLSFISFTTLLIGAIGIANSVKGFLNKKTESIATLKSLGASSNFIFNIYIIEILILASLGILIGLIIGVTVSQIAGNIFSIKLGLVSNNKIYTIVLFISAIFGYLATICASLWPIGISIKTSPAYLFRKFSSQNISLPSIKILLFILVGFQTIVLLSLLVSQDNQLTLYFLIGVTLSIIIFYSYALIIKLIIKRFNFSNNPELRLATSNIYRPGNVSSSIILSLGLGLTVLVAASLVHYNFSNMVDKRSAVETPSFFFLDIRADQIDSFKKDIYTNPSAHNLKIMPSLRGRIIKVNNIDAKKMLIDKNESWVINSDRRFTYSSELPVNSKIIEGKWWANDYKGKPLVSIATNVQRAFNIGVGDEITINIMGKNITAKIANVREISWGSFTLNFAITFAPSIIDKIPANYIATVIINKKYQPMLQNKIAKNFPNITTVKLSDILNSIKKIINGIGRALNISVALSLSVGMLVLAGGIAAAQEINLYNIIILKVLGATRKKILKTFLIEYSILGIITVFIAASLGTIAAYSLQKFILKIDWEFSWVAMGYIIILCLAITIITGFISSWKIFGRKPAPFLRN